MNILASDPVVPRVSLLFQFTGAHSLANTFVEKAKVAGAFALSVEFLMTAGGVDNALSIFRKSWNWWFVK
jgi:hypothetical protein